MRRADRLFQILQLLRGRKVCTAEYLAERLEVSVRTIYRDMQDLLASGIPLMSEAGVGYSLSRGYDLPPLMFDAKEIEALVLGARMVASWGDEALSKAAEMVLQKVEQVLPRKERHRLEQTALFAISYHPTPESRPKLAVLRQAINSKHKLAVDYEDAHGTNTTRVLRPLALYFWGKTWTLGAWCEQRQDFRNFRVDRILNSTLLDSTFELEPPCTLADFKAAMTDLN